VFVFALLEVIKYVGK